MANDLTISATGSFRQTRKLLRSAYEKSFHHRTFGFGWRTVSFATRVLRPRVLRIDRLIAGTHLALPCLLDDLPAFVARERSLTVGKIVLSATLSYVAPTRSLLARER